MQALKKGNKSCAVVALHIRSLYSIQALALLLDAFAALHANMT